MRKIVGLFVVVLVLMLLSSTVALAQDAENTEIIFCGGLSEEDCALLNAAQTALWDLTSGETVIVKAIWLDGFPRLASDGPALTVSNRSMFVADQATIDQMLALQGSDTDYIVEDPDMLANALLLPLSIDTASSTTFVLSPEISARLSEAISRNISGEFIYETRLIDGVLYINLSNFREVVPEANSLGDWIGIDLMAFVPKITTDRLASDDFDAEEIASELEDALITPGQSMMAQPYFVMVEPDQEEAFNQFLEIIPLRDAVIDGQDAAVYRMKMDVGAYTSSAAFVERVPGLTQFVRNVLPANMQEPTGDRDVAASIVQSLGSVVLGNAEAMVIQAISYEDAYLLGQEMHLGLEFAGRGVNVDTLAANANMNNIESIPVPANAFVPPIRLILGLIETFAGGE